MRALSSSSVCSLSSNFGDSFPIRRAVPFLAMSQAICTCWVSGNMSGASRAFASTAPSKDFAFACSIALSKIFESERSIGTKVSIDMVWIGDSMILPFVRWDLPPAPQSRLILFRALDLSESSSEIRMFPTTGFRLSDHLRELVERSAPAVAMSVALGFVGELLMDQREDGAVAVALERDGDERLPLGLRAPLPGEHELLIGHDLAVDAAHVVLLSVRGAHEHTKTAAHARVGLRRQCHRVGGRVPPHHFFRVGPRLVDFRGRGVEPALESEAGLGG